MDTLVACDFFAQDIVAPLGRMVAYCLFFLHLQTRKVVASFLDRRFRAGYARGLKPSVQCRDQSSVGKLSGRPVVVVEKAVFIDVRNLLVNKSLRP
jgi:hypothetical protein